MTQKEKAEDLFITYRFALSIPNAPLGELKDDIAKQCALIAVNEILSILFQHHEIDYWNGVKQEIENL